MSRSRHGLCLPTVLAILALGLVGAGCGGGTEGAELPPVEESSETEPAQAETDASVFTSDDIEKCAQPTESVKIGSAFELSGSFAAAGRPGAEGLALAVDEITNGGEGGFLVGATCFEIELIERDVRSDPATTVAVTRSLVQDQGVKFLYGPGIGGDLISAYQVSQAQNPKPIHFGGSVVLELQGALGVPQYAGMYRVLAPGEINADAVVAGLEEFYPDAKTISFLWPDDVVVEYYFERGGFTEKLASAGLDIVADDRFAPDTADFSSFLLRVKAAKPDILVIGYLPDVISEITKQAMQLGVESAIVMFNGTPSIALKDATGGPLEVPALNVALGPDMEDPGTPELRDFVDRLVEFTGRPIDGTSHIATQYYWPTYMLIKAMQTAGTTTDVDAVNEVLLTLRMSGGPLGHVCWNSDHIAITTVTLVNIVDGEAMPPFDYEPSTELCVGGR